MRPISKLTPRLQDVQAAFSLLTRLPVGTARKIDSGAGTSWAWPLAGAAVGALGAAAAELATAAGAGHPIAALFAVAAMVAATGALHEDGLADAADGLLGGSSPEQRLLIMKDSRIGAFGATVLMLFLIGRHSCLEGLMMAENIWGSLIAAAAISRGAMLMAFGMHSPARTEGMAAAVGKPPGGAIVLGGLIAVALGLAAAGWPALPAAAAAVLAALAVARFARFRIGGITGDVLGAAQSAAELACLILLASIS